jgi:hypothetical protein
MKKDTALRLGLMLLGILLSLGPLLIALGTHNWNIMAAVMPSDAELQQTTDMVTGLVDNTGFSANTFSIGLPTIQGNTLRVPTQFTSPFKIPITLKSLTVSVSDQGATIAQLQTEGSVEIPASGTASITFVGTYTGTTLPTNPQISGVDNMTIEVYGITISAQLSSIQGG